MRTVKHQIKPLTPEQEIQFLALARAYQFEKNYWSDQLLNGSHEASLINIDFSYNQIRDKLVQNNYQSINHLPAIMWKMSLKEAYDLHIRTYESQIAFLKRDVNNRIYKFKLGDVDAIDNAVNATPSVPAVPANMNINGEVETDSFSTSFVDESKVATPPSNTQLLNTFKKFLYFTTNSLFYNYKTFRTFEEEFYSKKFRKARIYQRIQPILKKLFDKAMSETKDVFQLNQVSETNLHTSPSENEEINTNEINEIEEHFQLELLQENIEKINQFLQGEVTSPHLKELLNYYCTCLVKAIVKFRNYKPIQSQINPTITLDGNSYRLYSKYDEVSKKNRWFLDIMSMEFRKRIKGLELTGFHHAKKIMKHKKYPNLTLSFNPTEIADGSGFIAHFTFPVHKKKNKKKIVKQLNKKNNVVNHENNNPKNLKDPTDTKYTKGTKSTTNGEAAKPIADMASTLMTLLTVGGDFGLTENFTFSDGWVSGQKQGKILNHIANSTKNSVAGLQRISEKGYFGVEKNNKTGKRNHKNNCFNHNQLLGNINENYRKKQQKHNQFLQNYKYLLANEIIEHFTSDSIYGQYSNATHDNPIKLVFEDLNYTSLGFNANQKRQFNLIKGILNVLEEKIRLQALPIEIQYVHPGYTSQNCPHCYFVSKANRDSKESGFRCQHCGFTANDDERFKWLTKVVRRAEAGNEPLEFSLPSEDDFIAACNIAERLSTIPNSTRLRLRDIKYRLIQKHESVKVSCKIFTS